MARRPSLVLNTIARFAADGAGMFFGLLAGMVSARWLGPGDKGTYSSLTYLAGVAMQLACMGLGDAATILVGQKRSTLQRALSASIGAAFLFASIGAAGLFLASWLQFISEWDAVRGAAIACAAVLPLAVVSNVANYLLNTQERLVASSAVLAITSGLSAFGTWLFIAVFDWSVTGGVLAGALGTSVGLAIVIATFLRSGLSLRPTFDRAYLAMALRLGPGIQASYLLMTLAGRVDLLFVYRLAGKEEAGQYSIALTLGALASVLPTAMSHAAFPRMAQLDEKEALAMAGRTYRVGVAGAIVGAIGLLFAIPIATPLLFGEAYLPSVIPGLLLLPGGLFWSGQWLLARFRLSRGNTRLLFISYGVNLAVMALFDVLLVPRLGTTGAAIAAVLGPLAGWIVAVRSYGEALDRPLRLADLVPGRADFATLWEAPRRLFAGRKAPPAPPAAPSSTDAAA